MEIKEIKAIVLEASEGHYLIENKDIPNEHKIISDKVYLANPEDASNWTEITIEEGDAIKQIQEEILNNTDNE